MKYLLFLIALMNIIVISRKHLSRKSKRTQKLLNILITIPDDDRFENPVVYNGQVQIPDSDQGNEITLLITSQNNDSIAVDESKVEGTNLDKQKTPFFQKVPAGYILTINKALCLFRPAKNEQPSGVDCFLNYGSEFVFTSLTFTDKRFLNISSIIEWRYKYFSELEKEIIEKDTNAGEPFSISVDEIKEGKDLGVKKHELACMTGLKKVPNSLKVKCDMQMLYSARGKAQISISGEILENFKFNFEEEKISVLASISTVAEEYQKILAGLNFDSVNMLMKDDKTRNILDDLKNRLIKNLLIHLGVEEKQYEFYSANVSQIFYAYINKFYLIQLREELRKTGMSDLNRKAFDKTAEYIMTNLSRRVPNFSKRKINLIELDHMVIIERVNSDNFVDFPRAIFDERSMLFLRKQFINNEKVCFRIISLVDSRIWIYNRANAL
jgi:hypothetical protein